MYLRSLENVISIRLLCCWKAYSFICNHTASWSLFRGSQPVQSTTLWIKLCLRTYLCAWIHVLVFFLVLGRQAIWGQQLPSTCSVLNQHAQHLGLCPPQARYQNPQVQGTHTHRTKHTSGSCTYFYTNCHLRLIGRQQAVFKKNQQTTKKPSADTTGPTLGDAEHQLLRALETVSWPFCSLVWWTGATSRNQVNCNARLFKACHMTLGNVKYLLPSVLSSYPLSIYSINSVGQGLPLWTAVALGRLTHRYTPCSTTQLWEVLHFPQPDFQLLIFNPNIYICYKHTTHIHCFSLK